MVHGLRRVRQFVGGQGVHSLRHVAGRQTENEFEFGTLDVSQKKCLFKYGARGSLREVVYNTKGSMCAIAYITQLDLFVVALTSCMLEFFTPTHKRVYSHRYGVRQLMQLVYCEETRELIGVGEGLLQVWLIEPAKGYNRLRVVDVVCNIAEDITFRCGTPLYRPNVMGGPAKSFGVLAGDKKGRLWVLDCMKGHWAKERVPGHRKRVSAVQHSYIDQRIYSASLDGTVKVWSEKLKCLHTYHTSGPVVSLAVWPSLDREDNPLLLVGNPSFVVIVSVGPWKEMTRVACNHQVRCVVSLKASHFFIMTAAHIEYPGWRTPGLQRREPEGARRCKCGQERSLHTVSSFRKEESVPAAFSARSISPRSIILQSARSNPLFCFFDAIRHGWKRNLDEV